MTTFKSITSNFERSIQAKVQKYEKQIDEMVYKLYGLSEGEKRIVEGKN